MNIHIDKNWSYGYRKIDGKVYEQRFRWDEGCSECEIKIEDKWIPSVVSKYTKQLADNMNF